MITQNEKSDFINEYCEERACFSCTDCVVEDLCEPIMGAFEDPRYASMTDEAYERLLHHQEDMVRDASSKYNLSVQNDVVNHPSHYTQGGIECIDAMEAAYGKDRLASYCIINAFKYLWRSHEKNGIEDVKKAKWYIDKHLELTEEA